MQKQNLTIGIVIPTYNRVELLKRAISSIKKQTYTNWVVCIVDDGSNDTTKTFLQEFKSDLRIHYILQPSNQGVNAARNAALDYLLNERSCDFITFLDDDDFFHEDALLEAKKNIDAHPDQPWLVSKKIDIHNNDITKITQYGVVPYIDYYLGITMDHDATHVIASSLIGSTRFSKQFKQAEEWVFFMELSAKSKMFTYNFGSTVCTYLDDGLSAQVAQKKDKKNSHALAVENLKKETLTKLGYKPATIEVIKLGHRIKRTVASKKYPKLLRYVPRYLYWKFKELSTLNK